MNPTIRLRQFKDGDYHEMIAVTNAIYPEDPRNIADVQRRDQLWDGNRFEMLRLVGENEAGQIVAWGQLNHLPHQFHPRKYRIGIYVEPRSQRSGAGGLIHDRLMSELNDRQAIAVNVRVRSDMAESIGFLENRDFARVETTCESRLTVASFDPRRFEEAAAQLACKGITFTSLADERGRNAAVLQDIYSLYLACLQDVPTNGAATNIPFSQFVAREIDAPNVLPDAYFLAVSGGQFVAVCAFIRHPCLHDVLVGRMTGCLPSFRGQGIAPALKLCMAAYARTHGFREIWTWNSAQNASMLKINETLGFVRHTEWLTFEKGESSLTKSHLNGRNSI
jgi:mycothiol synthase